MRHSHYVTFDLSRPSAPPAKPAVVLACFEPGPVLELLARACSFTGRVIVVPHRADVMAACIAEVPRIVVVPPQDERSVPMAPLIVRLCELQIGVAVCIDRGTPARGVVAALHAGAQLLAWGTDSELHLRLSALIEQTVMSQDELATLTDSLLALEEQREFSALLRQCTIRAHQRFTVQSLARLLGVSARTLHRITRRNAWPPPSELIAWGRLLRASLALRNGSPAGTSLARMSGFASATALQATLQSRLHESELATLTPLRVLRTLRLRAKEEELRQHGAFWPRRS